jgi:hypothetical protein
MSTHPSREFLDLLEEIRERLRQSPDLATQEIHKLYRSLVRQIVTELEAAKGSVPPPT